MSRYFNIVICTMYIKPQGIGAHGVVHWGYVLKWYTAPYSPDDPFVSSFIVLDN